MELTKFFDRYNLFARVYPVLLLLLPSVITVLVFKPEFFSSSPIKMLISSAIFSGFLYLLANLSRYTGKRLEKRLISSWGGWPTTILLRHSDTGLSAITKQRYHLYLTTKVPGLPPMPTPAQEQQDPNGADAIYSSAVLWLKEQRRDEKLYPVVMSELVEYGFRRNLASLRGVGFTVYLVSFILIAYMGYQNIAFPNLVEVGLLNLLALGCTFLLNDNWVKESGKNYAYALLATCDM